MKRFQWTRTDLILLVVFVALGATYVETRTLRGDVAALRELKEASMQTMESEWTTGGTKHKVSTPRNDGESVDDWMERHKEALDAAQTIWPPD